MTEPEGPCWFIFKAPEGNRAVLPPLVYVELGSELDILSALVLLGHFELGSTERRDGRRWVVQRTWLRWCGSTGEEKRKDEPAVFLGAASLPQAGDSNPTVSKDQVCDIRMTHQI